jgi:hypothetical protein
MTPWYERPIDSRAKRGGEVGVDGIPRKGGEFMPFYIPRSEMPQISASDYPELMRFADAHGVKVRFATFKPNELKIHQHINESRLRSIIRHETSGVRVEHEIDPVLTSNDRFILDGNHRLSDHKIDHTEVPAIVIDLPFEKAIDFLFKFPKVSIDTDLN